MTRLVRELVLWSATFAVSCAIGAVMAVLYLIGAR